MAYASRLQDVEINARRSLSESLTLLAGVRYLDLDDHIEVRQLTFGGADPIQHLAGLNSMVGFQIGTDNVLLRRGGFSLDTGLKAGIYDNFARNRLSYDSPLFNLHAATGAAASHAAFCGEIALTLAYDLTEHLSVRGGYQLLWLDGVALASQQPAVNPRTTYGPATSVAATATCSTTGPWWDWNTAASPDYSLTLGCVKQRLRTFRM